MILPNILVGPPETTGCHWFVFKSTRLMKTELTIPPATNNSEPRTHREKTVLIVPFAIAEKFPEILSYLLFLCC